MHLTFGRGNRVTEQVPLTTRIKIHNAYNPEPLANTNAIGVLSLCGTLLRALG